MSSGRCIASAICVAILQFGILMPMVRFFVRKIFGTLFEAWKMKVKAPGVFFFKVMNCSFVRGLVYSEACEMLLQRIEKLAFSIFLFLRLASLCADLWLLMSQTKQ